jgi:hypothetical protein
MTAQKLGANAPCDAGILGAITGFLGRDKPVTGFDLDDLPLTLG